jgi:hypothetical protein
MSRRLKLDAPPTPVLIEGDARVQALQNHRFEPHRPEEFVSEISRLWSRAQGAFLEIGRLLIKAKDTLPHGDYSVAVEAELPFSSRTAYQLREAARWVMNGRVPVEQLPGSYSTIYLLSTLDLPLLEQAKHEGLIRPELKRAELLAWRQSVGGKKDRNDELHARLIRLRQEKTRIENELRRIEEELAGL